MALEKENIYWEEFVVRGYEVDCNNRITLPGIANFLQEAAGRHTIEMKIAIQDLLEKGLTWVLMRIKIEMFRYPLYQEKIRVETYPTGFEKYYVYRDFKIFDANSQLIGQAASTWLVMDVKKRSMVSVPDFIKGIYVSPSLKSLPYLKSKLPAFETPSHSISFPVLWHHLDVNQHVNNTFYMQWMLESMEEFFLKEKVLREMDILYRQESHYKDVMISLTESRNQPIFLHQLKNAQSNTLLAEAQTKWESE